MGVISLFRLNSFNNYSLTTKQMKFYYKFNTKLFEINNSRVSNPSLFLNFYRFAGKRYLTSFCWEQFQHVKGLIYKCTFNQDIWHVLGHFCYRLLLNYIAKVSSVLFKSVLLYN